MTYCNGGLYVTDTKEKAIEGLTRASTWLYYAHKCILPQIYRRKQNKSINSMQKVGQAQVLISKSFFPFNFNSCQQRDCCYVFRRCVFLVKRDSNAVLFRLCAKLHTERANGSQSWVTDLPTDIITESQLRPSYPLICPLMKSQITLLLSFFLEYSFWPLMPTTHTPREMNT